MRRKLRFEQLDPRLMFSAGGSSIYPSSGDEIPQLFIVQFEDPVISRPFAEEFVSAGSSLLPAQHLTPSAGDDRKRLTEAHSQFILQAETVLGEKLVVSHEYIAALNGICVEATPEQANLLAEMGGVRQVVKGRNFEVASDTGPIWIGAAGVWDGSEIGELPGSMGEGILIGVIDTGINPLNPSFAAVGTIDGYVHTNPLGSGNYLGLCADSDPQEFGCNDKLIGVYDFTLLGPLDSDGHGSHTASTAAGNFVDATVTIGGETIHSQIFGVAPHANIIAYDACIDRSCSEPFLLAAIDQAILDGVDVINYSIRGTTGNPWTDPVAIAMRNVRDAGIFVAVAAGNLGPDSGTVLTPANAPWVTTVGATSHGRVFANSLDVVGPGPVPVEFQGFASMAGTGPPIVKNVGPHDISYAGDVDPGNDLGCDDFPNGVFQGQIVLIQRGTCLFETKVNNAASAGASAVVIFNHLLGPHVSMAGLEQTSIPSVFLTKSDGEILRDFILSRPTTQVRIDDLIVNRVTTELADIMADFSSRGPDSLVDIIVPDVTAPGANILAAGGTNGAIAWEILDGTSMATPHVAGAAALLMNLHPDWSPAEIQSALMTTSIFADVRKEDGQTLADPFDRGAGRIDVSRAANAGIVLDETTVNYLTANPALAGDPKTLNLASMSSSQVAGAQVWTRTLRNTQSVEVNWTATVHADEGMELVVLPSVVQIPAGGSAQLTVAADLRSADVGMTLFGTLTLSPDLAGVPEAHFPIAAVFVGPDIFPPQVIAVTRNDGIDLPDEMTSLTFHFDQDVSATLSADDLLLFNETSRTPVDLDQVTFDSTMARWDLSALALPAAFYRITLSATGISDSVGNFLDGNKDNIGGDDFVQQMLVALPGDASLDGLVNGSDFNIWNTNVFTVANWDGGDFNHDSFVDVRDFNVWNANKFTDVLPSSSSLAVVPGTPRAARASITIFPTALELPKWSFSVGSHHVKGQLFENLLRYVDVYTKTRNGSSASRTFDGCFGLPYFWQEVRRQWGEMPIRNQPALVDCAIAEYFAELI